jgi:hypothetical protein
MFRPVLVQQPSRSRIGSDPTLHRQDGRAWRSSGEVHTREFLDPHASLRAFWCIPVHYGVMKTEKAVRQSVSLPPRLAKQVGSMAKNRKLSRNRMLVELIENGIEAQKRKQQQFFALAERFRNEQDPDAANRLGDELGRMVFGG